MKPYTDIMLDIETLGTGNNAAIIQIGAVAFNADGDNSTLFTNSLDVIRNVGQGFRMNVDLANSKHPGDIDPSTVRWWLTQSDEARASITENPELVLGEVLYRFAHWIGQVSEGRNQVRLWSNGPTFDETIVRAAFTRYGMDLNDTVSFRGSRCCRTMWDIAAGYGWSMDVHGLPSNTCRHDGLADAIHQARVVSSQRRYLCER